MVRKIAAENRHCAKYRPRKRTFCREVSLEIDSRSESADGLEPSVGFRRPLWTLCQLGFGKMDHHPIPSAGSFSFYYYTRQAGRAGLSGCPQKRWVGDHGRRDGSGGGQRPAAGEKKGKTRAIILRRSGTLGRAAPPALRPRRPTRPVGGFSFPISPPYRSAAAPCALSISAGVAW